MTDAGSPEDEKDARSHFLATMSHDLRTPLTALRGALGLLERKELPADTVHQMVAMLRRASDRLERLTLGLIAIELIDNGTMTVLREVADLREIVDEVVTTAKRSHAAIEVELPEGPVDVACDRERAAQAIDHILDNARKFGGPDGTISISVASEGGRGVVRVRDEGSGVRPEDRERVFERYVQIGERLQNEPRGAGIGLYLARWNAEAMGGSARIVEGGPGATVEFSIPAAPRA
jgi:signal transduction histidine kinase